MAQSEQRKDELLQRMTEGEEMNRRANEKKAKEDALRAAKHDLRQQEIKKSQARLARMEEYRLKCLLDKVEGVDKRVKNMQDEREKEMRLMRRIKQDSFTKQRRLQEEATMRQHIKNHPGLKKSLASSQNNAGADMSVA